MATAMALRAVDDTHAGELAQALNALGLGDIDRAAVALAKSYAAALDADHCSECGEHRALDVLGPKYQAALDALGATPAARSRQKGGSPSAAPNRLHALRDSRRA